LANTLQFIDTTRHRFVTLSVLVLAVGPLSLAQLSPAQAKSQPQGIPIAHRLTIEKCAGCHKVDQNGLMSRISYIRTTPEIWEQNIKRMIRLNGLSLSPAEAKEIVKYLSSNNGLAPEEMETAFWEVDHSLPGHQYDYVPEALAKTCNYCHTIGRVLLQRRTREDYEKLAAMHVGLFPGAENQFRPRHKSPFADPVLIEDPGPQGVVRVAKAPEDPKAPIQTILDYLSRNQPLITPEWTAWKATMSNPKLAGTWVVNGYQPGKGKAFGTLTIQATAVPDEFTTKLQLYFPARDAMMARSGKGLVYTGYSWRGRQHPDSTPATSSDPGLNPPEWREAMVVSSDEGSMHGRWFWGGYDEFGIDVTLTRLTSQPVVLGTDLYSLQSPSTSRQLRIFGANLPTALKPGDVDLGPGITVTRVVQATPTMATVEVTAAKGLASGIRNVSIGPATAVKALSIFDKVAYIQISPDASMARLGGGIAAKQYSQLEALAFAAGPDGKKQTADDIPLGPVQARWALEELYSTPDDDDIKYVGSINSDTGLFTPNIEGPNPQRKKASNNFPTNNWGDVWVNAAYDVDGVTYKSKSFLVVTIPQYVRYDQPEVSQ
jgi:quinohemoprotein amine dehydrogenase